MQDKQIQCKECGKEFVFTQKEQEFYKEKEFKNEPQRCPKCRTQGKQMRRDGSATRELHTVRCSSCGKEAQVPFKPSGDRPVYCKECYQTQPRS